MKELILFIGVFVIAYLFYLIFVLNRKNVLNKMKEGKEITYLKIKYGIKVNDKNLKNIAKRVVLANSFILAITVYIVCLFNNIILQILIGFIVLIMLILTIYHLLGKSIKKKQEEK